MKTQETKNLLGNQNTQKAINRTLKRIIEHTKMVYACRTLKGYIVDMISSNTQEHPLRIHTRRIIALHVCRRCPYRSKSFSNSSKFR